MRTLTIKSGRLGRYDDVSSFLIKNGTLELQIALPPVSGEFFLVTDLNGKNGGAVPIPKDGVVTVNNLKAGELNAAIKHYLRGELIETYKVEPLILKAVETDLSALPEIIGLRKEIEALKELYERFSESTKTANETLTAEHNKAISVINDLTERVFALEKNYDPTIIK